jgi:hypothetical protein
MKKYIVAFTLICAGIAFYFFPERKNQEIFSSEQKQLDAPKENSIQHSQLGVISAPASLPPDMLEISDNTPPQEAINEFQSEEFRVQSALSAGYSGGGERSLVKNQAISISQMPEALQPMLKASLTEVREKGYESASEEYIASITDIENNLMEDQSGIKNLSFEPSKIQDDMHEKYRYEGYAYDSVTHNPDNSQPANSVRRLFRKMDSNGVLIIEESTLQNGHNALVKEFVNSSVSDQEAMYSIRKSPSNKAVSLLTWNGKKHSYTLYQYGDNTTKEELLEIANKLDSVNN